MKPGRIKPISDLESHTTEIVNSLIEEREPFIFTQDGEAKVVLQDYESFEQTQETLALLKILALGNQQIKENKIVPANQAVRQTQKRREEV